MKFLCKVAGIHISSKCRDNGVKIPEDRQVLSCAYSTLLATFRMKYKDKNENNNGDNPSMEITMFGYSV